MKKIRYWLLCLLFTPLAMAQTVNFTWTSDGNASVPTCSSTVTTSCIVGLTLSDITNPSSPVIISSTITPSTLSYTYPVPALTAAATRTYSLVTNAKDSSGAADPSGAATTTVAVPQIPPNPPAGFTGAGVADMKLPDYQPPIVALLDAANGMNFHAYIVAK